MSLATSPSLPCCNLAYAMLRHISIKVQNQTGYTRRSWIHLLCEHFPRNSQKKTDSDKNWDIYTSLKFSLWIKVQHRLAKPLPVGQCAPRPTRWCHWVQHVVGKRASASPQNSQQLCPPQSHWHIGPSSQGPQASDVTPHGTWFTDQERRLLHVRMWLWDCQAGPTLSMSCALSCSLTFIFFFWDS